MDQEKGAGHHVITQKAVGNLFASSRAVNGQIVGMGEDDFYSLLDGEQAHMDRWYGPTIRPFWLDEKDQREHGMAAGNLTGAENVARNRAWVEDNAVQALIAVHNGKMADAMRSLGAAVHALEDSYSQAHAFRDPSAHAGNPDAPIESLNVFDPTGISGGGGILGVEGTHDPSFDKVPLDASGNLVLGDDKAAVNAVTELLDKFVDELNASVDDARSALDAAIANFFQTSAGGATVNLHPDASWTEDRDLRKAIGDSQVEAAGFEAGRLPPEVAFCGDLAFDPNPPAAGTAFTISWQETNSGGPSPAYTTAIRYRDEANSSNAHEASVSNESLMSFDTASRTYRVESGIPAGSRWRFELTLDAAVAASGGTRTLVGEIEAT